VLLPLHSRSMREKYLPVERLTGYSGQNLNV
jgi:hypothetical protein